MFLPQSDIFKDIRHEAVHDISEIAVEETHEKGTTLFSAGDPAKFFYILAEGKVSLTLGEKATSHFTVNKTGELFGWSAVVGRPSYSAGAECLAKTKLIKIGVADLEKVFDAHARSGRVFYRRVAEALGVRCIELHRTLISELERERDVSYGTGQTMGTGEE